MAKAILMCLVRSGQSSKFHLDEFWLHEFIESLDYPTYRKLFTTSNVLSVVVLGE